MKKDDNRIYFRFSYKGKTYGKYFKDTDNILFCLKHIFAGCITTMKKIKLINSKKSSQVIMSEMENI